MIDRRPAGKCAVKEVIGLVDAVRHFTDDHGFSIETRHGDILVGGDDDGICSSDFRSGQHILRAYGALGLGFQG